jgi:hypothetical protein
VLSATVAEVGEDGIEVTKEIPGGDIVVVEGHPFGRVEQGRYCFAPDRIVENGVVATE